MQNSYRNYGRSGRSTDKLPWKWIIAVAGIILLLIIVKMFSGTSKTASKDYLTVTP